MNDTMLGVIVGGLLAITGGMIASVMQYCFSLRTYKRQKRDEVQNRLYAKKEAAYIKAIGIITDTYATTTASDSKMHMSNQLKVRINEIKAELALYATTDIRDMFYELIMHIVEAKAGGSAVSSEQLEYFNK